MQQNSAVLEADLRYAMRMVHAGFYTPGQAAQMCGISLAVLQSALATADCSRTAAGNRPRAAVTQH